MRHFLFLQGVASPFFARLADHLSAQGHRVSRINFCTGDAAYWGRRPAWHYRAGVGGLRAFLTQKLERHAFTDIVLFGSRRPVHRDAIALAVNAGIPVHVFEEGYIRPNWLTLERDGVNDDSALPRDPDWYRRVGPTLTTLPEERRVKGDIRVRAAHDLAYHLCNALNPLLFPGYRTHRPHSALVEYMGWMRRFTRLSWIRRRDAGRIQRLLDAGPPFYLLPLQLNADIQITEHSPFSAMPQLIREVLTSFARWAPQGTLLVIKNHPLDTGLVPYARDIAALARELAIEERVLYLETGPLEAMIDASLGVVTVNSTVGMTALARGRPTIALGNAIYDMPGLTCQAGLDPFWQNPAVPEPALFAAFRDTVIHTTQLNGDLYTREGIRQALDGCDRLLAPESPLQRLLAASPPTRSASQQMESA